MYAQRVGQTSPMPSMQFCIENLVQAGGCTYNYSCVYIDSISWASPNEPLPMIRDPRVAFDMLFGAGGTTDARAERLKTRRSILDWINGEVKSVRAQLGPADRIRLDRYIDNVDEIERRIKMVEARNTSGETRELPDAPAGVPDSFSEHMKLMFDLQVEHQFHVLRKRVRHAGRRVGQLTGLAARVAGFDHLDAAFDFVDVVD